VGNPTAQLTPIFGSWHGLQEGVKLSKTPIAYTHGFGPRFENEHIFAVYVHGERMSPRFLPGELAYIDPVIPPQCGKDILVVFHGQLAILRQLVSFSPNHISLRQLNPLKTTKFVMSAVENFFRVKAVVNR